MFSRDGAGDPPPQAAPAPAAPRRARASDEIAARIRAAMVAGHLGVGSRLPSERAMAQQFGVSRNTLREALRSLEHAGLLNLHKGAHGGAFIAQRGDEAVATGLMDLFHLGAIKPAQLTDARIWIESVVVREACRHATPADLELLRRNVEAAQAATTAGDFASRAELHIQFHRLLARMARNPIIEVLLNAVLDVVREFVRSIGERPNLHVLPSRWRFIAHLETADEDAAVAEMEASLKRLQRGYLSRAGKRR